MTYICIFLQNSAYFIGPNPILGHSRYNPARVTTTGSCKIFIISKLPPQLTCGEPAARRRPGRRGGPGQPSASGGRQHSWLSLALPPVASAACGRWRGWRQPTTRLLSPPLAASRYRGGGPRQQRRTLQSAAAAEVLSLRRRDRRRSSCRQQRLVVSGLRILPRA